VSGKELVFAIGTINPVKIRALEEILLCYEVFKHAKVSSRQVISGVSEQPRSLGETIQGAKNRARQAYKECDIGVGIEDGLMAVPDVSTGFMNVCVCAIYDGDSFSVGFSSAFEYPEEITELIIGEGMTMSQALHYSGLTDNPDIGSAEGAVGVLSQGRLMRKAYTEQAIVTALIRLLNKMSRGQGISR